MSIAALLAYYYNCTACRSCLLALGGLVGFSRLELCVYVVWAGQYTSVWVSIIDGHLSTMLSVAVVCNMGTCHQARGHVVFGFNTNEVFVAGDTLTMPGTL